MRTRRTRPSLDPTAPITAAGNLDRVGPCSTEQRWVVDVSASDEPRARTRVGAESQVGVGVRHSHSITSKRPWPWDRSVPKPFSWA